MALQYVCDVCGRQETVTADVLPYTWMRLQGAVEGQQDFCSQNCLEGYMSARMTQPVDDIPF